MSAISQLSDDELGLLIKDTAITMDDLTREAAAIADGRSGGGSAEVRRQLAEAHGRRWNAFKKQYDALIAELTRRVFDASKN